MDTAAIAVSARACSSFPVPLSTSRAMSRGPSAASFDLSAWVSARSKAVDRALDQFLPKPTKKPATIHQAMRYSLFAGGKRMRPALGCSQRTELAVMLGLPVAEDGSTDARAPMGTPVPGLYCAGDIVEGLDQISVAMGHGAIAATRAHNWLREQRGHTLQDS